MREGYQRSDLSTVEGIQSMLGVHEYYGHGIKNYSGGTKSGGTHWKAYDAQVKHRTFEHLSPTLQENILSRRKEYMRIEDPILYQKNDQE